ncbi:hypothetical protein I6G82_21230 [Lysinibacillus macroides]|uniref:Uncharacterized protein n=1 Tax=Lysinibacillus macroides TaxID=33935 RepID=A0A0M9DFF4_9BACI|nr:hypothetical protein [Lysinibacillus macroides]KOY80378.1 hypothetical protein ADM90_21315 [Lysinibacillus macroides]QPR67689.1 hypothetical protein I6G82_21230 [Lysinibacillus macroides]
MKRKWGLLIGFTFVAGVAVGFNANDAETQQEKAQHGQESWIQTNDSSSTDIARSVKRPSILS